MKRDIIFVCLGCAIGLIVGILLVLSSSLSVWYTALAVPVYSVLGFYIVDGVYSIWIRHFTNNDWVRWYAWYPVKLNRGDSLRKKVWRQEIHRRASRDHDIDCTFSIRWDYKPTSEVGSKEMQYI